MTGSTSVDCPLALVNGFNFFQMWRWVYNSVGLKDFQQGNHNSDHQRHFPLQEKKDYILDVFVRHVCNLQTTHSGMPPQIDCAKISQHMLISNIYSQLPICDVSMFLRPLWRAVNLS